MLVDNLLCYVMLYSIMNPIFTDMVWQLFARTQSFFYVSEFQGLGFQRFSGVGFIP